MAGRVLRRGTCRGNDHAVRVPRTEQSHAPCTGQGAVGIGAARRSGGRGRVGACGVGACGAGVRLCVTTETHHLDRLGQLGEFQQQSNTLAAPEQQHSACGWRRSPEQAGCQAERLQRSHLLCSRCIRSLYAPQIASPARGAYITRVATNRMAARRPTPAEGRPARCLRHLRMACIAP